MRGRTCLVRWIAWENLFPRFWQQKGCCLVCVRVCLVRLLAPENFFPHSRQKSLFPVCVRMWLVRVLARENILPHWRQKCDFLSTWFFTCLVKHEVCVKHFPHWCADGNKTVFLLYGVCGLYRCRFSDNTLSNMLTMPSFSKSFACYVGQRCCLKGRFLIAFQAQVFIS